MDLMSFMAMNPCHDIDNMHTLYMDHSDYHDIMDPCWIIIESLWIIGVDCLHQSMAGRPVCLPGSERGKALAISWRLQWMQLVGGAVPMCRQLRDPDFWMVFPWFCHGFPMVFLGKMAKWQFSSLSRFGICRNNCGAALVCCSQTLLSLVFEWTALISRWGPW